MDLGSDREHSRRFSGHATYGAKRSLDVLESIAARSDTRIQHEGINISLRRIDMMPERFRRFR